MTQNEGLTHTCVCEDSAVNDTKQTNSKALLNEQSLCFYVPTYDRVREQLRSVCLDVLNYFDTLEL